MKRLLPIFALLGIIPLLMSMGKNSSLQISWLSEGDITDGPKMVRQDVEPAPDGALHYFRISPMVTQRNIRAMKPMPADDGTWGAVFLLDEEGWKSVQATSSVDNGKLIRVMVSGRPIEFQRITRPVTDDHLICIWRGITEAEISGFKKKYKEFSPPGKPAKR